MNQGLTLRQRLDDYAGLNPMRRAVSDAVAALALASIDISELTCRGALAGITGSVQ